MSEESSWTDEELLDVLRFADDNQSYQQIAEMMVRTRGQVAGVLKRIRAGLAKSEGRHDFS